MFVVTWVLPDENLYGIVVFLSAQEGKEIKNGGGGGEA
jgi:hypothetical protein